ncbi:hypothetical protein AB5J62_20445 [Amycolatopsis sp. cg5]|uniref:hypothetical protein n=1 Tax=Amycolatopsis sp. cg5 TaxID=3238802 RepID=UPI003523C712
MTAAMTMAALVSTAGPAAAAATLTIDENAGVSVWPYGVLQVFGTATCAAPGGTATISVNAIQIVMHMANGSGSTTITCAAQAVPWSVSLGSPNAYCGGNPTPGYCFAANSVASAFGNLTKAGVQEATAIKVVHT